MVYKDEKYDPENPRKGLLMNVLLLKASKIFVSVHCLKSSPILQAFKSIFTSPSSAESERQINDDGTVTSSQLSSVLTNKRQKVSDEKCTCSHVAALLGMKSITPQSIAYVAVQVGII